MEILILDQIDNWEGKNDETEWLREIGNGEFKNRNLDLWDWL